MVASVSSSSQVPCHFPGPRSASDSTPAFESAQRRSSIPPQSYYAAPPRGPTSEFACRPPSRRNRQLALGAQRPRNPHCPRSLAPLMYDSAYLVRRAHGDRSPAPRVRSLPHSDPPDMRAHAGLPEILPSAPLCGAVVNTSAQLGNESK
jgi:hypothetical protein